MEGSASAVEWLTKQRPHMLACPSCRKSLPRCALCLLPMGCINPVIQLQHEIRQRTDARMNAGLSATFGASGSGSSAPVAGMGMGDSAAALGAGSTSSRVVDTGAAARGAAPSTEAAADQATTAAAEGRGAGVAASVFNPTPGGQIRDAMSFDDFWCWCQSCRHGGHASHLAEWFSSKTVCPVAECMCHCIKMDGFGSAIGTINASLLSSGSVARWGMPFKGGKLSSTDAVVDASGSGSHQVFGAGAT